MEKFKTAFFDLLHGDKSTFIFIVAQLSIGLLFWVALFMPYLVSPDLINGRLRTVQLPGGAFYTVLFLGLIVLFVYLILMKNVQRANKVYLALAIIATLIYLYALLFNKVGLPTANNGIGKILEFLLLIMFWFIIFGKKQVEQLILKFIPMKSNEVIAEVEEKQ